MQSLLTLRSPNYSKILPLLSLVLVILVILWGAFVRASGSGAGCGAHWPLCNGEILVRNFTAEKFIEFFHRITSGLSFIVVLASYLHTRKTSNHSLLRATARYSFIFICTEALIGAGLVLFGWVKDDSSVSRAFVVAGHLINSFALLFSLGVFYYLSLSKSLGSYDAYPLKAFMAVLKDYAFTLFIFVMVSSFGAVTALGDTIFPSASLLEGFKDDLSVTSHFLIRLRMVHPILALYLAVKLFYFFSQEIVNTDTWMTGYLNRFGLMLLISQIVVGALNVLLLAPTFLQIAHLALAVLLWLACCFKLCSLAYKKQ